MYSKINIQFLLFFFLLSKSLLSQTINVYGGCPYYFMQLEKYGNFTDVKNKSNYIIGVSTNKYFESSKIELGFAYKTKNYSFYYRDIYSTVEKENVQLNYYLVPLFYNQKLFSDSSNTISLSLGTVFIKAFGYSKEIIFKDGTKTNQKRIPVNYKFGNTIRLGLRYSKFLSSKLIVFSELYCNYKFNIDYYESGSSLQYFDLTDDRFDIGINIGIEWIFNKKKLNYYKIKKNTK